MFYGLLYNLSYDFFLVGYIIILKVKKFDVVYLYLVFRCSCGRATYVKEGVLRKKCVCGKTFKVKDMRILHKAPDAETASELVRRLQEEKYGGGYFTTADKLR